MSIGVPGLPIGLRKHSGVNLAALLWPTGTEAGMWLDPSDASTAYQDSAGTTAGAIDSPVGKRVSKAGNLSAVLQATATARPVWKLASGIYSDLFDGTDDGYATATFAAGTLTNNMDALIAIKRDTTGNAVAAFQTAGSGANFFGLIQAAQAAVCAQTVGAAWTAFVDGSQVGGTANATGGQLDLALNGGTWHVLEFRNLDLSAFTGWRQGFYNASYPASIQGGGVILCPAQSDATRAIVRRELGRKVGLSL